MGRIRGKTRLESAEEFSPGEEASQAAAPGLWAAKGRAQNCGENSPSRGGGLEEPQTILGASGWHSRRAPPPPPSCVCGGVPGGGPGPAADFTLPEPPARAPETTDPRLATQRGVRPQSRPRATSGAYHPPRHTPALPRSREWCGPARPLTPARGGAPSRHVTGSDLAARRHGGFGPGSGALGSRRCRGDGGSRSRSWSSRRSGGGGRGSGSRSAARAPCAPAPPSACGTALRPQDGRRVRGPGLRGQRPDH